MKNRISFAIACVAIVSLLSLAGCGGSSGGATAYTIGGTVTGLTVTGLVLQNNGGDDLTVDADGAFTFATGLADASTYAVTVLTNPTGETCTVTDGSGTVAGANITNVSVSCSATTTTTTTYVLIAAAPNGDLYTLNESSGAATLLLDTSTDGSTNVGVVSSMLYFSTTGVLWLGMGGKNSNPCPACIMILNTSTGVATMLADNDSANGAMPGLAMDSAGNIFSVLGDGDILVSVDSTTGLTTQIDPGSGIGGNDQGNGMTFDNANTLFVGNSENLYNVDTGTGAGTDIGGFTFIGFTPSGGTHHLVAMATRPSDGIVVGLVKETGSSSSTNSYLVTVNTTNAELTLIGQTDKRYDGLVFIPSNLITPP